MNIILLIIDTLRYDHVAIHGENSVIETPNLDRFAAKSWVFTKAFASSYPTIPHRTDVITGRYGDPFNPWLPLPFDAEVLPRLLADEGYCTQLIHDTPHLVNGGHAFDYQFNGWTFVRGAEVDRPWVDDKGFVRMNNWGKDAMFDFVDDPEMTQIRDHTLVTYSRANRGRERPEEWNAAKLFLTVSRFLRENARRDNFFLWADCFDPHEPWDAPPEFVLKYDKTPGYDGRIDPRAFMPEARHPANIGRKDVEQRLKNYYAAKVSWVDHWFGTLLETLEETGLMRNTAVVVTADHGTNIGERGMFGKSFPVNEQEGHVPLLIYAPDLGSGRSDAFVQPQDIFATILGLAGAAQEAQIGDGSSLLPVIAGGSGSREVSVAGKPAKVWTPNPDDFLFSVFGRQLYLNFAPNPEACRLTRYGMLENVAADNPREVEALREAGLGVIGERGIGGDLMGWLRSEGTGKFPEDRPGRDRPPGYRSYWDGNYNQW